MRRRRATVQLATPGEWGVRRLAVANGPNIFQTLLVFLQCSRSVHHRARTSVDDVDRFEPGAVPDHLVLEQDLRDAVVHLDHAPTGRAVEHARVLPEDLHRLLDPLGQVASPLDAPAHRRRVAHDHRVLVVPHVLLQHHQQQHPASQCMVEVKAKGGGQRSRWSPNWLASVQMKCDEISDITLSLLDSGTVSGCCV